MTQIKRPRIVPATTSKIKLVCGVNMYVHITELDGKVFEVFANIGKAGGCAYCMIQAITTAVTMGLRNGVPVDVYAKHFKGSACPNLTYDEGNKYHSCVDAIGQLLEEKGGKE
jgi:ribonucleoside-diphosphate reductase alpha chain